MRIGERSSGTSRFLLPVKAAVKIPTVDKKPVKTLVVPEIKTAVIKPSIASPMKDRRHIYYKNSQGNHSRDWYVGRYFFTTNIDFPSSKNGRDNSLDYIGEYEIETNGKTSNWLAPGWKPPTLPAPVIKPNTSRPILGGGFVGPPTLGGNSVFGVDGGRSTGTSRGSTQSPVIISPSSPAEVAARRGVEESEIRTTTRAEEAQVKNSNILVILGIVTTVLIAVGLIFKKK